MGHRYFIPSYLSFTLLACVLLKHIYETHPGISRIIYTLLITCLISGNFWIYPDRISQGWDASLAHIHYFNLRHKAISYIEGTRIKVEETATFFPNNTSIDAVDLNGDDRRFLDFSGVEPYVLYSNVYNIKDSEYNIIHKDYELLKTFEQLGVRVELWAKK